MMTCPYHGFEVWLCSWWEAAERREEIVNRIAIESSARMGGADFDPWLEVVGSRSNKTVDRSD